MKRKLKNIKEGFNTPAVKKPVSNAAQPKKPVSSTAPKVNAPKPNVQKPVSTAPAPQSKAVKADVAKKEPRQLAPKPKVSHAYTTRPFAMNEDGAVMTSGGAGASVSPIGGPQKDDTASASMSSSRKKMLKRAAPVVVKEGPEHGSEHTANRHLQTKAKPGFYLVKNGQRLHDEPHRNEKDVLHAYRKIHDTTGIKIHKVS
jgi:hypothetical protein